MNRLIAAPAALLLLIGCGSDLTVDAFQPHELGEPTSWGNGIEGYDPGFGGGGDSYDGTYEGTYSVSTYLADFSVTCSCTAGLTMVVDGGLIVVGFGESCTLDCSIGTQLGFDGSVGADGAATGTAEESTSFYYNIPWSGSFDGSAGSGSFSEAGLSTSQGTTDVSGSFSVSAAR
jgi:hypothetical protein